MKAVDGLKKCSKCGEVKKVEEFGIHSYSSDGYKCRCKSCRNQDAVEYRLSRQGLLSSRKYSYSEKFRIKSRERNALFRVKNGFWPSCSPENKHRRNAIDKARIDNLDDRYVIHRINREFIIDTSSIPEEMIEVKRLQLTNKRFIKKLKQCKTLKNSEAN